MCLFLPIFGKLQKKNYILTSYLTLMLPQSIVCGSIFNGNSTESICQLCLPNDEIKVEIRITKRYDQRTHYEIQEEIPFVLIRNCQSTLKQQSIVVIKRAFSSFHEHVLKFSRSFVCAGLTSEKPLVKA